MRLTKAPGRKELATFSPDGQFVALVRDGNLYVIDVATQTERALTTDGSGDVSNGKADWVYCEEIFDRSPQRLLVEPRLAADRLPPLRRHARPQVHAWSTTCRPRQDVEDDALSQGGRRQPAGQARPRHRRRRPGALGRPGQLLRNRLAARPRRLAARQPECLLLRPGPRPDLARLLHRRRPAARSKRLFRETTKAWVDDPGPPIFLKDGSFLLASERTGWKHLYHYDARRQAQGPVTSGEWELTTGAFQSHPSRVDEKAGWVYFTAHEGQPHRRATSTA